MARSFEVTRQWRGATFHITVSNPDGVEKGVKSVALDGVAQLGPIAAQSAGSVHRVEVTMG